MAGKNLYEILEVAANATPETVSAAYQIQRERLKARESKDPAGAATLRLAVEEAYQTLSNPQARARYDVKSRQPIFVVPAASMDDDSWFVRNRLWIGVLVIAIAGSGYYYDRNKKQRIAVERKLAEQEAVLARERKERADEEAARERAAAQRQAQQDRARDLVWQEQVRAQARGDQLRRIHTEERDRQLAQRQKLMEERQEEAERLRQENEARRNLEREKQKLRQLECARGPC